MRYAIHTGSKYKALAVAGVITWLITGQLAGCTSSNTAGAPESGANTTSQPSVAPESESNSSTAHVAMDDAAYLTQLGLIRGHLAVGYTLYRNNLPNLAETHMKHPRAEIYTDLVPAFAARGCDGFAAGLTALTKAVVGRDEQTKVDAVYQSLLDGIATCEAGADLNNPGVTTKVIENLLNTAGDEYQIGVVDGAMNNLHEYQDAWGFTQVAATLARSGAYTSNERAVAVGGQLQELFPGLAPLWPSLNPAGPLSGDAAVLFGAAGRVELIGLSLQR